MPKKQSEKKSQEIKSTGLGDTVEKVFRKTGIDKLAKAVLGEDCGCENRQELLNTLFPYGKYNAPTDEELDTIQWLFERSRNTISGSMVKEIYSVYNRIFNDKLQPTNCSSCFKPVKQKLLKIHNEFNKE
tara:strand:+ start:335 stop:724 length:390 start_codon:yes stop_codon:yes gene_type:complete